MNRRVLTWMLAFVTLGILVVVGFLMFDTRVPVSSCFSDNGTKSYVGLSQEQCMTIRFVCAEGEEYFSDECGCGCIPSVVGKLVPIYCTPESKEAEFCTKEYDPVCAWSDPEKVQCIKYPCAVTASNKCEACKMADVSYYTEGLCPSGDVRA